MPWYGGTIASATTDNSSISIKLLDAPVNRRDDPRAQVYIVDHLAPRVTINRHVMVTNNSPIARQVDVYAGAAGIDNNTFEGLPGRATNQLTSWVSLDQNTLDIPARGSVKVLVTIAVGPDATQGEHYGVIWAETSAVSTGVANVTMIARVGVRIYLDVGAGGEPPSDFGVSSLTPARTKNGRPEVLAAVHNIGGRALDMAGELSLSDGPGSLNAGPFPATGGTTLLPGHTASVQVLLDRRLPDGPWKVTLTLRSGSIEHTVTATLTFPSADDAMGRPVSPDSWIAGHVPLVIALAAVVIVALALLFVAVRRRLARQRV
jgi:hypothetical protein